MQQVVGSDAEMKLIAILKVLSESSEPLGSITIARRLEDDGIFLSERAVRYHLKIADVRGYTSPAGRDGRMITPEGRHEVKEALASQQLGFVREKLETLAYQTTFDPVKRCGRLAIKTRITSSRGARSCSIRRSHSSVISNESTGKSLSSRRRTTFSPSATKTRRRSRSLRRRSVTYGFKSGCARSSSVSKCKLAISGLCLEWAKK